MERERRKKRTKKGREGGRFRTFWSGGGTRVASKILWRSSFTVSPSKMDMGYFVPFHSTSIVSRATGKAEDDDEQEDDGGTTTWTSITPPQRKQKKWFLIFPSFLVLFFVFVCWSCLIKSSSLAVWWWSSLSLGSQKLQGCLINDLAKEMPRPQKEEKRGKVAKKTLWKNRMKSLRKSWDQKPFFFSRASETLHFSLLLLTMTRCVSALVFSLAFFSLVLASPPPYPQIPQEFSTSMKIHSTHLGGIVLNHEVTQNYSLPLQLSRV